MIPKKDCKPFLIKQPIGVQQDDSSEMIYEDNWTVLYGLISDPMGRLRQQQYGNELPFDKVIRMNYGSAAKQITYDTIFMIDDMPTNNYPQGDYSVSYIYPPYNGEIVIGLDKVQGIKIPRLYYYSNNLLLYYQINYDTDTKIGYIKKNLRLPFANGSSVWTREPSSAASTSNKYVVSSIEETGYDEKNTNYNKITLTAVDNGKE